MLPAAAALTHTGTCQWPGISSERALPCHLQCHSLGVGCDGHHVQPRHAGRGLQPLQQLAVPLLSKLTGAWLAGLACLLLLLLLGSLFSCSKLLLQLLALQELNTSQV